MIEEICEEATAENNEGYLLITLKKTPMSPALVDIKKYVKEKMDKNKKQIVIDLTGIGMANSALLGLMANCSKYLEKKEHLNILVNKKSIIEEIIYNVNFDAIYSIYNNKEELIQDLMNNK
jgi:anti-anti-sigma regulatory factor